MKYFKERWKSLPATLRKPIVLIIGVLVVIGGIILLPLPGPGWVVIFAGFALLATEFELAEKVHDWLVDIFKIGAEYLKKIRHGLRHKESAELPKEYDALADVELKSPTNTGAHTNRHKTKH